MTQNDQPAAPGLVVPVFESHPAGQEAPLTRREALARERAAAVSVIAIEALAPAVVASASLPTRREIRATAPRRAAAPRRAIAPRRTTSLPRAAAPRLESPSAPRPGRSIATRRTTRFGALGAMLFVGATIVSTSVPANAYFVDTPEHVAVKLAAAAEAGTTPGGVVVTESQKLEQGYTASAAAAAEDLGRDGYKVTSPIVSAGTGSTSFTSDPSAAVQWPFPESVPISSGFGGRQVANCSFCSTYHQGLDFIPGAGTLIHVVADGVVSKVDEGSGALGYNVWVDHVIGGEKVTTVYAHMKAGSIKMSQGEAVKVGQIVGQVGSTGNSTGAHLHFEVHLDGLPVDPMPWLQANAGAA